MELLDRIQSMVKSVNDVLWGPPMLVLLFGTHLFLTFRTGFIQRKTFKAIKLSVTKDPDSEGDISQFGALTTALASTIGTGNIIGVGTAVALGGPGAVLWCWLTGVFGIATKYAEALIAVKYRVKTKDGRMQGGAMYALERGLHMKWLAVLFALFALIASFGIGSMVQTNAIASVWKTNLNVPGWMVGILCGVFTMAVIFGGVKAIAKVCEKLVPFMALFYVIGCVIILCYNYDFIVPAIRTIVMLSLKPGAAAGGLTGSGIMMAARYGIARGLFSNESGMGSAPIVAAAAKTRNPVRQALVSSTGTFWDTVVVCAMTGIVLVSSIMKNSGIDVGNINDGGELTSLAFAQIPYIGKGILLIGIVSFAFSTILGWAYYGERCAEYLGGRRILIPYRILYVVSIVAAPLITLNLVWDLADTFNALMAIPNLVALLFLSNVIVKETKKYINDIDRIDDTEIPYVSK
ncbi:MAG: sodium:alanine symporter family protein [Lachnospiraceae bacterium]|nr:sodium:alanine symporter family protein [Lachnospiraceae bacterium]